MTFHANRQNPSPARSDATRIADTRTASTVAPAFFVLGTALALGTAVLVFAAGAQAQGAQPAAATSAVAAPAPAEPKYTVAQIAQAFSFIDSNKDGKLSREEAAGFRGVARHFDEADINKDGVLSRDEFESALSGEKSR